MSFYIKKGMVFLERHFCSNSQINQLPFLSSQSVTMSEKSRVSGEVELDFDRLGRIGNKINELLVRKTKGTTEAYAVLRFLCAWYEEELGITFAPEFDEELHKAIRKSLDAGPSQTSKAP